MSFDIYLYQNNSENNRAIKDLTQLDKLTGELREGTSILYPTILCEYSGTAYNADYMYISEFGRYYYIKDINKTRNGLLAIEGRRDPLQSFNTAILAHKAVIMRQENKWNLYLDDGTFKTYNNPYIITKAFPSGFTNPSFILAVAGGQ